MRFLNMGALFVMHGSGLRAGREWRQRRDRRRYHQIIHHSHNTGVSFWKIYASRLCQYIWWNGVIWSMPGRISLCSSMPVYEGHPQGVPLHVHFVLQQGSACKKPGRPQGAPLQWNSYCNRVGHTNGDPFPSTTIRFYLWSYSDPRAPGSVSAGAAFSPDYKTTELPKGGSRIHCRQQLALFGIDFFSGQDGVLQQSSTYKQQGRPQGTPLQSSSFGNGADTKTDRSVFVNNSCPLPLETL